MNSLSNPSPNAVFLATEADANTRSSVARFVRWLDAGGLSWVSADLKDYLDYLNASDLAQSSVKKHMERIRARYRDMQHSNVVRDMIQSRLPAGADAANAYAVTEEFLTRLRNNTEYDKRLEVKLTKITTYTDDKFTWMSRDEILSLFWSIEISGRKLWERDAAIFGLCLSFGLREEEACNVTVDDLNKFVKGVPGVEVRRGKGNKQRFIQYDELTDYTRHIQRWLEVGDIASGLVLQGLKPRQLQNRVKLYTTARPHDLRRTYAKLLHEGGRSIEFIGQQLGHSQLSTTMRYLGLIAR